MKNWLTRYLLVILMIGSVQHSLAEGGDRPNILFILADDVGREVLECYGGSSYATPNLNQLAASGATFQHCYAMPVCHPTRVTLLTGQYPRQLGNPKWGSFPKQAEQPYVCEHRQASRLCDGCRRQVAVVSDEERSQSSTKTGIRPMVPVWLARRRSLPRTADLRERKPEGRHNGHVRTRPVP